MMIHFERSNSMSLKYLSVNLSFCVGSVRCMSILMISCPFEVSLTLSNSSKNRTRIHAFGFHETIDNFPPK